VPNFWPATGYTLLAQSGNALLVTDDFIRALFLRPEVAPIAESCAAELWLHEALMASPQRTVAAAELLQIADPDAQATYRIFLKFRDRLLTAPTLEAAYTGLFRGPSLDLPPLFVFQLTQILLRHILGAGNDPHQARECDPLEARMAECLFRVQKVVRLEGGAMLAIDGESGDVQSIHRNLLSSHNAAHYWSRDERHDLAVNLGSGQPALHALMRVLEKWVAHFLGINVTITECREFDAERWVWHVGLDATASALLNDLYNKAPVTAVRLHTLLARFELNFNHPADMRPDLAGRPVYLAMAMDSDGMLKLKPQNLLLNLPLNLSLRRT
jgi:hypothetical protein